VWIYNDWKHHVVARTTTQKVTAKEYSSERRAWFSMVQDILLQKVPEHPIPGLDVDLAYRLGVGESYDSWQNESMNMTKKKRGKDMATVKRKRSRPR